MQWGEVSPDALRFLFHEGDEPSIRGVVILTNFRVLFV